MENNKVTETKVPVFPLEEKARLQIWPRIGIRLEKVMAVTGHMEDLAGVIKSETCQF